MSTFEGLINDIPGTSIDNFSGKNKYSALFLLSHCHRDHMNGLDRLFLDDLKETNRHVYCSAMSKTILQEMNLMSDPGVIRVLEMNSPKTLTYTFNDEEMSVTVTCIPSGHCPGSVMFVLEKDDKSILYTGDFRYNVEDMHKMQVFKSFDCVKRNFNKIFLDATFLLESYPRFPSREESTKEIIRIAQGWLDADNGNLVHVETAYLHGYEYIHKRLAVHFKTKVQVWSNKFGILCRMGMSNYVTTSNSRISIGSRISSGGKTLIIKPSAMIWRNCNLKMISRKNESKPNYYNVCFSTHSSMEELRAFVQHVHCNEIDLIAFPDSCSKMDVLRVIRSWTTEPEDEEKLSDDWSFHKKPKKPRKNELFSLEFLSEDEDF